MQIFYMGGCRRVNHELSQHTEMVCGERDECEGLCRLLLWCGGCNPRGLEKGITLTFHRSVMLDTKRQQTGSLKVKINLCQRSHRPRTRLPAITRFELQIFMFRQSVEVTVTL